MKRSLGWFIAVAAVLVSVPAVSGCIVTQNSDGSVTLEGGTRYEGTAVSKSVAYAAGMGVRVVGVNGDIKVSTGSTSDLSATFKPFTLQKGDSTGAQNAKDEMNNHIQFSVGTQGGEVVVSVARDGGASGNLGADVEVVLPASLSGAFTVQQGNGNVVASLPASFAGAVSVAQSNGDTDLSLGGAASAVTVDNTGAGAVQVSGASGRLAITGPFDVSVSVSAWAAAGQDGAITAGDLGSLTLTAPATATGTITAQAGGQIKDSGLPSNWASAGEGSSKSYTMGSGAGAKVALVAGEDITISN